MNLYPTEISDTTLPSWLTDFNGPVYMGNWNPDEDYCDAKISSILLAEETMLYQY